VKDQLLQELFQEHQKQFSFQKLFQTFHQSTTREILAIHGQREKALQGIFAQEISQKLQGILTSHQNFQEKLQQSVGLGFRASVGEAFFAQKKSHEIYTFTRFSSTIKTSSYVFINTMIISISMTS